MKQPRVAAESVQSPAQRTRRDRLLRLLLFGAMLIQLTWMLNVYPHWKDTNSASRVYLTLALVQQGTFQIDRCIEIYGDTLDKAQYKDHYYTDKAPGTSFLFLPVTWVVSALSPLDANRPDQPPDVDMRALYYTLRLLCISLPTLAFWWFALPWFREWTGREDRAVAVVAAGALGTNFFIYATQLYAHVPAAWFLFLSFLAARTAWSRTVERRQILFAVVAGSLAGLAFLNDYVVMLAVAVLGVCVSFLPRFDWRRSIGFGLGLAPLLAAWMAHNYVCFDHPLRTGFYYHALPVYGEAYRSGFLGIQPVSWSAAVGMLFSPARGILFLAPFLVLAPVGWWRQIRSGEHRADAICAAAVFASMFLFSMTTIDWRGGWGFGVRYLIPAVPFLLIGVAGVLRGAAANDASSIVFAALATVGVLISALAAATVPLLPQEFVNVVYGLDWPLVRDGYFGPHLSAGMGSPWMALTPYLLAVGITVCLVLLAGPAHSVTSRAASVVASLGIAAGVMAWQSSISDPPSEPWASAVARTEALAFLAYFDQAADEMLQLSAGARAATDGTPLQEKMP